MYGVRGMFGNQVVYKKRNTTRYVASAPEVDENRVPSEAEQANRDRFARSNTYAKTSIKDPLVKQMYEAAAKKNQTANNVAFSDAYRPPVIKGILAYGYAGVMGNIITVQATDNFKVTAVKVSIYDSDNILIEEDNAVDNGDRLNWMYTISRDNNNVSGSKIIVKAYDMPGNETIKEMII